MPRILKPGSPTPDPKAIKRRAEAARRARTTRTKRQDAIELDEAVEPHTLNGAPDPYELPDNVRPMKQLALSQRGRSGAIETSNDPALLTVIEWVMKKALIGFTYRQIAGMSEYEIGYKVSELKAKRFVAKEMAKRKDPLVKEIRKREDMRLDYLLTKLEAGVESGDVQAIHEARLISESRRRMFGADMPTNVRVTGEVEHKLDPAVTKMIEESKERIRRQQEQTTKELEDPAIIDAEIVHDEPDFKDEPYQEFLEDPEPEEAEDI